MFVPFSVSESAVNILAGPADPSTPHVRTFCERISPTEVPVRLPIRPEPGCQARECFANVRQKVARSGGRIRFGWAIWEWRRVFIEAEHHAVYEAPDGSLHDFTPSTPEDPQTARLFLPHDNVVYDFTNPDGSRRDNIRQALTRDAQIDEYLQLASEFSQIMLRTPGTGEVTVYGDDAARLEFIAKRTARLKREIAQRYTAQGAPCYCGGGQKFKHCHGRPGRAR